MEKIMPRVGDLDIKLLRLYATVVECRGFAGAQAMLNISQSAISTQMATLEERLGFRLCQRGRAGFQVTEEGERLYQAARNLFDSIDGFQAEAANIKHKLSGTLKIAMNDAMATNADFPLQQVIKAFNERDNDVDISLSVSSPREVEQLVLNGTTHLAIGPVIANNEGLDYQPLFKEHLALYCGTGHPLFGKEPDTLTLKDFGTCQFSIRRYLEKAEYSKWGVDRPRAFVSNMEAQATLILSGHYIGYLPSHFAAHWVGLKQLHKLSTPKDEFYSIFQLITKKGVSPTAPQRAFMEDLLKFADI